MKDIDDTIIRLSAPPDRFELRMRAALVRALLEELDAALPLGTAQQHLGDELVELAARIAAVGRAMATTGHRDPAPSRFPLAFDPSVGAPMAK